MPEGLWMQLGLAKRRKMYSVAQFSPEQKRIISFNIVSKKNPQNNPTEKKSPTPKTKPGKNWKKNEGYVIWTKNFYVMLDIYMVFSTVRD